MAGMDLARRAFAAMKGGGEGPAEAETESAAPDPKAAAGRKFKAAVDSGDGAKIASAFEALKGACEAGGYEDDDE